MQDHANPGKHQKRRFTFLITSARRDGNTEMLTRKAAETLPQHYEQLWLRLSELPLPPFEDIRHSVGVYPQPTGNERILFDATLNATDLVFSVPLYWYSVPTSAKHYLDYWSAWLRVPDADFRRRMAGKTLWGICVLSEKDQGRADPLINMLANTAITEDGLRRRIVGIWQPSGRCHGRYGGSDQSSDILSGEHSQGKGMN